MPNSAADAWSLGCCMYEVAQGKKLFAPPNRQKGPFQGVHSEASISKTIDQWVTGYNDGYGATIGEDCSRVLLIPKTWRKLAWACLNPAAEERPKDLQLAASAAAGAFLQRSAADPTVSSYVDTRRINQLTEFLISRSILCANGARRTT